MKSPYPEEFNRQAIGLTASLHFAPTQKAADALLKEGKDPEQIFVTGNTGIDALHYTVRNDFYHPETEWAKGSRLIAVTAHRRENLGEPMRDMFRAIRRIVEEFTDVKRTKAAISLIWKDAKGLLHQKRQALPDKPALSLQFPVYSQNVL